MPTMKTIIPTPGYVPKSKDKNELEQLKANWEAVKKLGPKRVTSTTAFNNIRQSKGMYSIQEDVPAPAEEVAAPGLEAKSNEELKLMLISLGIKTEKVMKRDDIIRLIYAKLDEIEVVDEEEDAE